MTAGRLPVEPGDRATVQLNNINLLPHAQVYALDRPVPLLTGPRRARVTHFDANEIDGRV